MRRNEVVLDESYFDRIFSEFRQVLASLGKVLPAVSIVFLAMRHLIDDSL